MSKFLTVVYRVPNDFNPEELLSHEYMSACSWSHALDERRKLEIEIAQRDEEDRDRELDAKFEER